MRKKRAEGEAKGSDKIYRLLTSHKPLPGIESDGGSQLADSVLSPAGRKKEELLFDVIPRGETNDFHSISTSRLSNPNISVWRPLCPPTLITSFETKADSRQCYSETGWNNGRQILGEESFLRSSPGPPLSALRGEIHNRWN